jgi:hypothetical protein
MSGLTSRSEQSSRGEERVERREHGGKLPDLLLGEAEREAELAGLVGLQARGRVDPHLEDLLGRLLGDLLDVHAALGAGHHHHAAGVAVDEHAEVELAGDAQALLDVHGAHLGALVASLDGDELAAEHPPRGVARGAGATLHHLDAAGDGVFALVDLALAAAPGVNLGLHHHDLRAGLGDERLGGGLDGVGGGGRDAARYGHAVLLEDLLALVLVNLHRVTCSRASWRR